jgi:hypothetical protein
MGEMMASLSFHTPTDTPLHGPSLKLGNRAEQVAKMATNYNNFQALLGAGEQVATASKKKKNNSKKPKAEAGGAAAPAPAAGNAAAASVLHSAPARQAGEAVDVSEATATQERQASEARDITGKCKLWKDWVRQVSNAASRRNLSSLDRAWRQRPPPAPPCSSPLSGQRPKWKGPEVQERGRAAAGLQAGAGAGLRSAPICVADFVQFARMRRPSLRSPPTCVSQVLLRSKALETSVESSIVSNLGHEHHEALSSVLATFLSASNPQMLASQLVRLSSLLSDEAPDTIGAAQRAVRSVVVALKAPADSPSSGGDTSALSGWVSRVGAVDKDISKQQGLLQKLASSSAGVVTK